MKKLTSNLVLFTLILCAITTCIKRVDAINFTKLNAAAGAHVETVEEPVAVIEEVMACAIEEAIPAAEAPADPVMDSAVEARDICVEMPIFNQCDYPNIPYGGGSVKSSGCGITSIAMVASYLKGEMYYPDELAVRYNGTASNNATRMLNAATDLGLVYDQPKDFYEMLDALEQGKVCIALMKEDSLFTSYGHFIVLAGLTEDGRIIVHDPWGPNYDLYPYEFANGFAQYQILLGYGGCWAFELAG